MKRQFSSTVTCGHCRRPVRILVGRGLCKTCHRQPDIRDLYVLPHRVHPGYGARNQRRDLPAEPTTADPGSAEKVAVLETRARAEVLLHHPGDRRSVGHLPSWLLILICEYEEFRGWARSEH